MAIAINTVERVCRVFGHLCSLEKQTVEFVSSKELAKVIGCTESSVRKDLSLLGLAGFSRKGYKVITLKTALTNKLHLGKERKACIVGLGRLGATLIDYEKFQQDGFDIVAGFDESINKIERIKTSIEVFEISQLVSIVKQRNIELGIIAVPPENGQKIADMLINAGVKGILNFSPIKIKAPKQIICVNMDFANAMRFIAAQFVLNIH